MMIALIRYSHLWLSTAIIAELAQRGLVRTISAIPPSDIVFRDVAAALREAGFSEEEDE